MSSQTQYVVNQPNKIVQPYVEWLLRDADRERRRRFVPYRGKRAEGLTRDQLAAMRGIRSLRMPQSLNDARALFGKAANLAGKEANFQHGIINAGYDPRAVGMFARPDDVQAENWYGGDWSSDSAQKYMNPYIQNVLNISKREAERDFMKQAAGQRLTAARQGAFGGSRAAIVERDMRRDHDQRMDDLQMKGLADAYERAYGMFDKDRVGRFSQAGMNLDADKYNAGLAMQHGMAGLDLGKFNETQRMNASDMKLRQEIAQEQARLGAAGHRHAAIQTMTPMAQGLVDIGKTQFGMSLDKFNTLHSMGEHARGIRQSALDAAYQDYLRQSNWGRDSKAWMQGIISGMPVGGNQFQYGSSPPQQGPSMASNLIGGAMGGLAAYGARNYYR